MASLIMHIVASKIIGKKYNLPDIFIAGSTMPDIYAKCNSNRDKTHYIDKENNLPNYQEFLKINRNNMEDKLVLGYATHLIEDYIWFDKIIPKYAIIINNNSKETVKYLNDGSLHTMEEFKNDLYKDYNFIDNYICNKYEIEIDEIKSKISKYYTNLDAREKLVENLYLREFDSNRENIFITHKEWDKFVEMSKNKVEEVLKEFLNKSDKKK